MANVHTNEFHDLLRGATVSQLMQLFEVDRREVVSRLRNIDPVGNRGKSPIYRVSQVAEAVMFGERGGEALSEAQRRKQAAQEKDYWDSQLKRQKFLEQAGDLWRTDKVIDVMAQVFKLFRESVVVFMDELEHESGLPPEQVAKAKVFGDGLLNGMRSTLLQMAVPTEGDHDLPDDPDSPQGSSDTEIVQPALADDDADDFGDF